MLTLLETLFLCLKVAWSHTTVDSTKCPSEKGKEVEPVIFGLFFLHQTGESLSLSNGRNHETNTNNPFLRLNVKQNKQCRKREKEQYFQGCHFQRSVKWTGEDILQPS